MPPMPLLERGGEAREGHDHPYQSPQELGNAVPAGPPRVPRMSRLPHSDPPESGLLSTLAPAPNGVVTPPPPLRESKRIQSKRYSRGSVTTVAAVETDLKRKLSVDASSVRRSKSFSAVKSNGSVGAFTAGR